jgi:hypothetical protein
MGNDVIIPPRDFDHLSRRYYSVSHVRMYEFWVVTWHKVHAKFNKFVPSPSAVIKCVQTDITCEEGRLGWLRLGLVGSGQVMRVMRMRSGSWVWRHPTSRHWASVTKILLSAWICSGDIWHKGHTKFQEFPSSHSADIKCVQADITCEEGRLGWVGLCACAVGQR